MNNVIELDPIQAERLCKVQGYLETTTNERHMLWEQYSILGRKTLGLPPHRIATTWDQELSGYFFQLGKLDNMPVTLCLDFATIDGFYTMFWYSPSMVTDSRMVDAFFARYLPAGCEHTDATNFCNLLHAYARKKPTLVDLLEEAY